jgi:hypothetical protein
MSSETSLLLDKNREKEKLFSPLEDENRFVEKYQSFTSHSTSFEKVNPLALEWKQVKLLMFVEDVKL